MTVPLGLCEKVKITSVKVCRLTVTYIISSLFTFNFFTGKAVANYDSVEDGDKIIDTAINNYGKVDIVINNAGILRDKSFVNMGDADWDKVFQVYNYLFSCFIQKAFKLLFITILI